MLKFPVFVAFLVASSGAIAGDSLPAPSEGRAQPVQVAAADDTASFGGSTLLPTLERYLRARRVELDALTPDQMVDLMVEWTLSAAGETGDKAATDTLEFRYGGWSEGCATGFRMGMLRRTGTGTASPDAAGITLMFEPSSGGDLAPFSTTIADWPTVAAFVDAIRTSPAYRRFSTAKPMSAMVERGGLR